MVQGLLKAITGIEISFTLTSKSASAKNRNEKFAELYEFWCTTPMVSPIMIIMLNVITIGWRCQLRMIYSRFPQWSKLLGVDLFAKGKIPTIVYLWSGLICIVISLLAVYVYHPTGSTAAD